MDKDFNELREKFKLIAKKKWIKSVTKGHGNIGLTFEKEIGKKIDTDYTPDYKSIEIKFTSRYSRYPISLFPLHLTVPAIMK